MAEAKDQRVGRFRALHEAGCFVMPNPWDPGSARVLESLGFNALGTTSAGFAWSLGRADNHVELEEALAHLELVAASVRVPVHADFEGAFASDADGVAANVSLAATTGIAGLSVEDSTGNPADPLYEFVEAVDRVRAARSALDTTRPGVMLTARSEGFIRGRPDLHETIRRLIAYAEAGADCLFAPGISTEEQITAVVKAVAPTPVNVIGSAAFTVSDLERMGVRRISVGGSLARVALTGFLAAAKEIAAQGTFSAFSAAEPPARVNAMFSAWESH